MERLRESVAELLQSFLGQKTEAAADKPDPRFKDELWENNFLFDYIKKVVSDRCAECAENGVGRARDWIRRAPAR